MSRQPIEWNGENIVDSNGDVKPADDFLDGEGGLIDAPDERLFEDVQVDERLIQASASAALRTMDSEAGHKRYPARIEDVIARRRAKARLSHSDDDAVSAQDELGGGVRAYRERDAPMNPDDVLGNVIDEYEPWQADIQLAVERFGVVEFSKGEIINLPEDKFDEYSLHFYGYVQSIDASMRLIDDTDGHVELQEYLRDHYPGRTPEEMKKYRETLKWLKSDLAETGILEAVYRHLGVWRDRYSSDEKLAGNRRKALEKLAKYRHTHKAHNIQVVRNKDKLQIEHVE